MNKGDLVKEVAKVVSTKKEAQTAVDCVFNTITKALKKKDTVTLVGFGTFKVNKLKARKGNTWETADYESSCCCPIPKFVAGKALKDVVK